MDVSRRIISIFRTVTRGEISRYFVTYLTSNCLDIFFVRLMVNFLDILPDFSGWFTLTYCRESHGEYYRHCLTTCYFVGHLTLNYLGILWGTSQLNMSIFCRMTQAELSGYFVGHLTLNYLGILSGVPRWIFSTPSPQTSDGKLPPYFAEVSLGIISNILSDFSRWIFSLFRVTFHGDHYWYPSDISPSIISIFFCQSKID